MSKLSRMKNKQKFVGTVNRKYDYGIMVRDHYFSLHFNLCPILFALHIMFTIYTHRFLLVTSIVNMPFCFTSSRPTYTHRSELFEIFAKSPIFVSLSRWHQLRIFNSKPYRRDNTDINKMFWKKRSGITFSYTCFVTNAKIVTVRLLITQEVIMLASLWKN